MKHKMHYSEITKLSFTNKLHIHNSFKNKIHLVIGGDHGGGSFKMIYQVCNTKRLNSCI